ncbi:hypothetical protein GF314_02920 [bacterium]|nr:hypothetical protein [bacterium]
MLRRFLLGALVVSLASMAWAGVPDLDNSTAVIDAAADGASVYVLPNGTGSAFTEAFAAGGTTVDATITLTLVDTQGLPIFLYPFEDLWLDTTGGNFAYCEGGTVADQSTDEDGITTWTNPLNAGGSSEGFQTQVFVAGAPLSGGLNITYNSADMNGDLLVNLSDIVPFTQTLSAYDYSGDFNNDGIINLSDIVRFTPGIGTSCN